MNTLSKSSTVIALTASKSTDRHSVDGGRPSGVTSVRILAAMPRSHTWHASCCSYGVPRIDQCDGGVALS